MAIYQQVLVAISFVFLGAVVLAAYQQRQQNRVHSIELWVRDFLGNRYGKLPSELHIHCSNDRLWPVLARFDRPDTGKRHSMLFECGGLSRTWSLVSERDEQR